MAATQTFTYCYSLDIAGSNLKWTNKSIDSGTVILSDEDTALGPGEAIDSIGTLSGSITYHGIEYSTGIIVKVVTGSTTTYYLLTDTPWTANSTVGSTTQGTTPYTICFLAGTQIRTPAGEQAIETLTVGDDIVLASGETSKVKWLGRMTVPLHIFNRRVSAPILIRAGALGNGLPARDLYTTPSHGFEISGVLVNAGAMVNGTSIVQCVDWPDDTVTYYQVELESHELMLVEGAASETFCQHGPNRELFDNASAFHALYPGHQAAEPMKLGRVVYSRQLPDTIRKRLLDAAVECGYIRALRAA